MFFEALAEYYGKLEGVSSRLAMIDILTELLKKTDEDDIKETIYMTQGILAPPFEGIETGIAEKFAENAIALSYGYTKDEVRKAYKKSGDMGSAAETFAAKGKLSRMSKKKFTVREVFDTMHKIALTSGQGSQDTKIKMLSGVLAASSPLEARYVIRFALGTLRLGVGDATILEALSKMSTGGREFKGELEAAYNICSDMGKVGYTLLKSGKIGIENFRISLFNPYRPALAERLPTAEEILEKMHGKCSVESKYDGLRAQVHMDKKAKKVEIFSRNLERLTPMFPELVKAALEYVDADKAILEGEAISYNPVSEEFLPFQETIQRKRKHGIEAKSEEIPISLFAFDLLYADGTEYIGKPYRERVDRLEKIIKKNNTIILADKKTVTTPTALDKYFNNAISKGLEGIVAKDLDSKYIAGARKFSWIKLKRSYKGELSDTVDLVIVGYYLGRGTRAEFKFGGLLAAVFNDKKDMFETLTKIGTGFTERQMSDLQELLSREKVRSKPVRVASLAEPDFWINPKYVVTVRADEITRSPMHTCGKESYESDEEQGYALRFPRLVSDGIRKDKGAEEATTTNEIISMYRMQKKARVEEETA